MFYDGWAGVGRTLLVGVAAYLIVVFVLPVSGQRTLAATNAFDR
jgi:hypothetical protein